MKKSILIINNGLAGGGIERASTSFANYLSNNTYKVSVLALYKSEHFFELNDDISFIEPSFQRNEKAKFNYVLKMMKYIRSSVKRVRPDIILAYGEWTTPFVIIALLGINIPLFITERMSPILKMTSIHSILRKLLYKKTDGIIVQTNYAKELMKKITKSDNIIVIPNHVNIINPVLTSKKKRIITVGRLSPEKGHQFLIEAFAKIDDKSWELSIIGDGIERVKLEKLAHDLNVANKITFYGQLKDFALQMSESEIFVLPSLSEGFPNALIEAMAFPLACISSDCIAGPRDIIENNVNGILVEPANVESLKDALNLLIENKSLRNRLANNAILVRDKYSFNKVAEEYINFMNFN
jgi:GalNAc-alpha-(1->4)-GalNAc-alpha-(1->3)-diNAcBac-PP-undecaprenol alpha-1,4-N-acetyl-D-galactosaminyltransferase